MRLARNLTVQVLVAVALGVVVGMAAPAAGQALRPLGDVFIRLVRMVIAPVIFLSIVLGIGGAGNLGRVGRIGGKALLYFEVVTTIALVIGLAVAHWIAPGAGLDPGRLPTGDVSAYVSQAEHLTLREFVVGIVPTNFFEAFARGDILQVVFVSVLFGAALGALGERGRPLFVALDVAMLAFFRVVGFIMRLAPVGAFGAMAFTVGSFGVASLAALGKLMLAVYVTMALFILVVLNLVARASGFSLMALLAHIRDEILLVLGTSSSEAALPRLMEKLEAWGCSRQVVGLVVPTGYSFNLDGTSIYLSMGVVFLAQVYGVELTLTQQATILLVLMLTSKGAAGVTGSGFIVLASSLAALKVVPVEGVALLLGVDRFMSEARSITNLIGNAVATVVIARHEGAFHPPMGPGPAAGPAGGGGA